jgi:small subunit ribosomal protein S16
MLRMRLRRVGKTKQPMYRVVIADQHAKRDGDFVEVVGHYNPRNKPNVVDFKEERVRHWLSEGVQPSETVHRLLFGQGLTTVEPPKRVTKPSKSDVASAEAERAAAASAAAAAAAEAARTAQAEAAAAEAAVQREGAEAEFTEKLETPKAE